MTRFLIHSTINPALYVAVGTILFTIVMAWVISLVALSVGNRIDRAEKALAESEERFRQLSEQSEEGFWFNSLDPERTLYVSPAVEHVWGLPPQRFYQDPRAWETRIHPDDRAKVHRAYEASLVGKATRFEAEYRVVEPNGSVRWVFHSGTPIRNAEGEMVRMSAWPRTSPPASRWRNKCGNRPRCWN